MRLKLTFTLLCLSLNVFSQDIEWSENIKRAGFVEDIIPIKGKDLYVTYWFGNIISESYKVRKIENFNPTSYEKVQTKVPDGNGDIENYIINNGKFVTFIFDKKDGEKKLYYQEYNSICQPEINPQLISSFIYPKGWNRTSYFNVIQSKNKEFFVVEYTIPGKKEENDRFGYTVMNSDYKVISKGEYESPFDAKESEFSNNYLSNTGDYFVGMKVYNSNKNGKVRDITSLKKYILFLIKDNVMEEMELSIGDKRISDINFSSDEKRLITCTGLYGKNIDRTKGVFYFQVDFDKKTLIKEGYREFENEFIIEDFSNGKKEKVNKGKKEPQLYVYDFRCVETTEDGSIIVIMEQYFYHETNTFTQDGRMITNTLYYYNDIIAYKVNQSGTFEWISKINKKQISQDDLGYYSSIGNYLNSNELVIFFNDNPKNYNESGEFKNTKIKTFIPTKYDALVKVVIDLKTGETKRTKFETPENKRLAAVPKKFITNYLTNELILYYKNRKYEKFGLLKF